MSRTQVIEYRGKKIFFTDFSNMKSVEEIAEVVKDVKKYIHAQPPMSAYTLTSLEGIYFNNTIRDMFTELVGSNKPFVKAGAIIGISGLAQIVYNGIMRMTGRTSRVFPTMDQAKNWLVEQ